MRVGIVMPTLNQGKFIESALRSIHIQEGCDFRLIVLDALSTDRTTSILETYADDPRIKWLRQPDSGQVDALNRGLDLLDCDVLGWLNSDDALLPDALASVSRAFEEDSQLSFVYGDAIEADEAGVFLAANPYTESPSKERYYFSHNFICQPTCFFRKAVWERLRPLRTDLPAVFDYEFFSRFFREELKGLRLPRFLAVNRSYADTLTNRSNPFGRLKQIFRLISTHPGGLRKHSKILRIYLLEAFIKCLSQGSSPMRDRLLLRLHPRFLKLVAPRERAQIEKRYAAYLQETGYRSIESIFNR